MMTLKGNAIARFHGALHKHASVDSRETCTIKEQPDRGRHDAQVFVYAGGTREHAGSEGRADDAGTGHPLYCASGGHAALAGKVLKDMGYGQVFNIGGFKDWADSGGPTEKR
jgi:rhodanese-related sulfurtransferase